VASAVFFSTTGFSSDKIAVAKRAHVAHHRPAGATNVRTSILRKSWLRIAVRATAYVVDSSARGCFLNTNRTASGTVAGPGTIAVDTSVFPFGTRFYVPGYGYGRATDTGGLIRGRHIDLAMRSCTRALNWGSRTVVVTYAAP
jgi:3D (Asp-Asp-Asp) domain-containing protein